MSERYVVLTCRKTISFGKWGKDKGLKLWVALDENVVLVDEEKTLDVSCALDGFAFVAQEHLGLLFDANPYLFEPKLFRVNDKLVTVTIDELLSFNEKLKQRRRDPATGAATRFQVGDRVVCTFGVLKGLEGICQPCKSFKKNARVLFGKKTITLPNQFLAKL